MVFLIFFILCSLKLHSSILSRNDLYTRLAGGYCIRSLTKTGLSGCASHYKGEKGELKIFKEYVLFPETSKKTKIIAVLPHSLFFKPMVQSIRRKYNLRGILILTSDEIEEKLSLKADENLSNLKSFDLINENIKIPVYLLTQKSSNNLFETLEYKENPVNKWKANLKSEMFAKTNSTKCMEKNTCTPVNGISVWGTYSESNLENTKFVLLVSKIPSNVLFKNFEFRSSLSGVTIMLSIAKTLKKSIEKMNINKNKTNAEKNFSLMYVALDKDEYDNMGSTFFFSDDFRKAQNDKNGKNGEEEEKDEKNTFKICKGTKLKCYYYNPDFKIKKENIAAIINLDKFVFNNYENGKENSDEGVLFELRNVKIDNFMVRFKSLLSKHAQDMKMEIKEEKINVEEENKNLFWLLNQNSKLQNVEMANIGDKNHTPNQRHEANEFLVKDPSMDFLKLVKIANVIHSSLFYSLSGDSDIDLPPVTLSTMNEIFNCLSKSECKDELGSLQNDISKIKFDGKNRAIETLSFKVYHLLEEALASELPKKNSKRLKCGSDDETESEDVCEINGWKQVNDRLWCLGDKKPLEDDTDKCFFSATYILPVYSPSLNFSHDDYEWSLPEVDVGNKEIFTISKSSLNKVEIYKTEKEIFDYVVFGFGLVLFLGVSIGYFVFKKLCGYKLKID